MIKLHGKDQKVLIIHIMVIYGLKRIQILNSSFILHLVKMLRIHFFKKKGDQTAEFCKCLCIILLL